MLISIEQYILVNIIFSFSCDIFKINHEHTYKTKLHSVGVFDAQRIQIAAFRIIRSTAFCYKENTNMTPKQMSLLTLLT